MSRRRDRSKSPSKSRINSNNPSDLDCRIFVGNLPTDQMDTDDLETLFSQYGKVHDVSMFRGFGFVQFERAEDADIAATGQNGRHYRGYRLDVNKAVERRNMNKGPPRSSPPRRDLYGYGESTEPRRDRSPIHFSPRRGSREPRERESRPVRDGREPRDPRDLEVRDLRERHDRDFRDARDARDPRDSRDARDSREYRDLHEQRDARDARDNRVRDARDTRDMQYPFERYRDARDPRDPLSRVDEPYDKYRMDEIFKKKDDLPDRYRDPVDRFPEDRSKREERRRELYRQYYDEIQRKLDAERPVDCSVVVVNKQSKEYAESLGRKVRDLGLMVDLIFLNTEVSLAQALEDVSRGGSPFAIVITQQHQTHHSCTVNILYGTPQEHRNMPVADAMVLVARSNERYKAETLEKEREDTARQAAKLSAEAILRERAAVEEGLRGSHPPGIMTLFALLADNRYITTEEIDKVIQYLQQRKERILGMSGDMLTSQLTRQTVTASMDSQSNLSGNQTHQLGQQLTSATPAAQTTSNTQQELQAKILSLFNSGASSVTNPANSAATPAVSTQNYGSMSTTQMDTAAHGISQQRALPPVSQLPNAMAPAAPVRPAAPRPGPPPQVQGLYGQLPNRIQTPSSVTGQRPGASMGINFDNPSVQKALDTLIQSGPALSHLVSQTTGQGVRNAPLQQSSMAAYPRHF